MNLSVFGGNGFVGGNYSRMFPDKVIKIDRDSRVPRSKDILYFISTVDNYNVFADLTVDVDTNLKILCEVLENCKDSNITFNFISSWFVYGDAILPAKEHANCNPKGFYSITKRAAEQLLISFCETYKVNYRILRLCNVYGVGDQKVSRKKNAIQYMIDLLRDDEDVFLYEYGMHVRDVMHKDDVCRAIDLIVEKGNLNEIYNIGSGQPTRIYDIISRAKTYLNSNSAIKSIEPPEFHKIVQSTNFWMDVSKLKNLGFEQQISLDEGIKTLCQ
jgi:nucleoside-diphosphate-sugar epimerase